MKSRITVKDTDAYTLSIEDFLEDVPYGYQVASKYYRDGDRVHKQSTYGTADLSDEEVKKLQEDVSDINTGLHLFVRKIREIHDKEIFRLINFARNNRKVDTLTPFDNKIIRQMKKEGKDHKEIYGISDGYATQPSPYEPPKPD